MNPLIPLVRGYIVPQLVFHKNGFGNYKTTKFDIPLNNKINQYRVIRSYFSLQGLEKLYQNSK